MIDLNPEREFAARAVALMSPAGLECWRALLPETRAEYIGLIVRADRLGLDDYTPEKLARNMNGLDGFPRVSVSTFPASARAEYAAWMPAILGELDLQITGRDTESKADRAAMVRAAYASIGCVATSTHADVLLVVWHYVMLGLGDPECVAASRGHSYRVLVRGVLRRVTVSDHYDYRAVVVVA